jgi:hypothetical protein
VPPETPSEWGDVEIASSARPRMLSEESIEVLQPNNETNGGLLHAENLKATDSDGEGSKTKSGKKSKKAKKRKDSMSASNF